MPDDKFIKNIGLIELWRNADTDALLKPATANAIAKPATAGALAGMQTKARQEHTANYVTPLAKLEASIRLAPVMAQVAVDRIEMLLMEKHAAQGIRLSADAAREAALSHTVLTLYKYFNFPLNLRELGPNDPVWITLEKVCSLYELTLAGLKLPYRLYLFEPQQSGGTNALGYVRHTKVPVHPLDIYFNTPPDENGHVPFPEWLKNGYIHLSMVALRDRLLDDSKAAHLLLHEATHKFANTKDICYKWDTIAQRQKHNQWDTDQQAWKGKAKELAYQVKQGNQPTLSRGDGKKPLMPLAKEHVNSDQWVYNADSYAWAARRLWKDATGHGSKEYASYWQD